MFRRIALVAQLFDKEWCIGFIKFTFDNDDRKLNNNKEQNNQSCKAFIQKWVRKKNYRVCSYQNTGQTYNTKIGLGK
jgi:hypothetical protein